MNYTNLVNKWDDEEDLIEDITDTTEPRETKFKWDEDEDEDKTGIQCATCGSDLTANKTGRPKKFCDLKCKNAYFNKKKSSASIGAHIKFNNIYSSLNTLPIRRKYVERLYKRYQQAITEGYATEESTKGPLTFAECEALTNMFLFGPNNKKHAKFVDKTGREIVNVAIFFMGYCFGHGIDPYDKEAVRKDYMATSNTNGGNV